MKQLTLCIIAMLLASISSATADDQQDFNQQTEGWDWLFTEKSENKKVSYPVETYYRIFENHPDYRVRGRFVYDKSGKLIRVAYLLSQYYEKWNLNKMLSDYNSALESLIIGDLKNTILSKISQVALPKKCWLILNPWDGYYWGEIITMDNRRYKNLEELNSATENPLPRNFDVAVGKIVKENGMPLAQKKLKEAETAVEQANNDTSVVSFYLTENVVYARCNQDWLKSKRNNIYEQLHQRAADYCKYWDFQKNNGYEEYWGEYNSEYRHALNWVVNALMIEDYRNNKYNVKGNQSAEVLNEIEIQLGIRQRKVVVKDEATKRRETMTAICEMLGIQYHAGINILGMSAQLRKLHPTWNDEYIRNKIVQTTMGVSMTMGLAEAGGNGKECPEAEKYLNQLRSDHKDEYTIVSVERMDDVTFKIHCQSKSSQKYAVIVEYYSKKPYSSEARHRVVKE